MQGPAPADIAGALEAERTRLGSFHRLVFQPEVDSTNDRALALAMAGASHGTSVLADVQHAGRGRRGHQWFSPAGAGLYLSVIVRPEAPPGATPLVTLAAGVAVAQAVRTASGLPAELKWPNDLVIGRPWRKLGGVLCEAVGAGPRLDAVVIGVGVNLRSAAYPPDVAWRATSVEVELGRPVERAPLVVELLAAIRTMMERLDRGDRGEVCAAWRRWGEAGLSGAAIRWRDQTGERRGRARGIDEDGALLVDTDGTTERLVTSEIEWEMWQP